MHTLPRISLAATLVAAALVVTGASIPGSPVLADGDPDVQLVKSSPSEVLYGDPIPVTLTASNAITENDGYNLSFTDTLPAGASLVSADPAPTSTISIGGTGETVIIWENVADLLAGASVSIDYSFTIDELVWSIGDSVPNTAGAFVSLDPRDVPDFDPVTGANVANGQTDGFATASSLTELLPFQLTKSENSDEGELLRGLHDHKNVYTLTIENNQLLASSGFTIVDYLPAGLEFLGCVAQDNSSPGVVEYTESGPGVPPGADRRIDATPHPTLTNSCPTPTSVTTVTDPVEGGTPLPAGVYTRVEWDAASLIAASGADALTPAGLAPGASVSFDYAAAIPLRENVQASLTDPTANIDNNTGPLTIDEQPLTNYAFLGGVTDTESYVDSDEETVTAEDLSIHKTVNTETFVQGASATWTFEIESSQYAISTDDVITVTDRIPNGLEYVSSSLPLSSGPTNDPVTGEQIVEWEIPAYSSPNSSTVFTMSTNALTVYRAPATGPVASNDSWENNVSISAEITIIDDGAGTTTSGVPAVDESSARQTAGPVTIDKDVAAPQAAPVSCGDGSSITTWEDTLGFDYREGDRVCWRLAVDFPVSLDTLSPFVKDFLPTGFAYESWAFGVGNDFGVPLGGGAPVGVNYASTPAEEAAGVLIWDLADADPTGIRFEVVVSSIVTSAAGSSNADIAANLMKFSFINTDGSLFQLRDQADVRLIDTVLSASKLATPDSNLNGGEIVTYDITFTNNGFLQADNATVVDTLPPGFDCVDVTNLGGATCADNGAARATLTWTGVTVPAATEAAPIPSGVVDTAGETVLSYQVTMPSDFNPASTHTNDVEMTNYQTATNTGGPPIDHPGPSATETVSVTNASLTKTRVTGVNETGNNATTQATIGETITYTVTATVPEGTEIDNAVLTDVMPAGLRLDSATATLDTDGPGGAAPVALPGTFTMVSNSGGFTVTFPSVYTNPPASGDDIVTVTAVATVLDTPANDAGDTLRNNATLTWTGGSRNVGVNTSIVEPNISLAKSQNSGDDLVDPGEEVTYTVTVSNSGSVAHDVVVTDTIPEDLIPLTGPGGTAVLDGGTVSSGGVWNDTLRTITWTISSVGSTPVARSYETRVRNPLTGGITITNDVAATATSMAGTPADERTTYTASASESVEAPVISIIDKVADVTEATVGDLITYTVNARIPADVVAFDVTMLDVLPAGVAFEALSSVNCVEPGPTACTPARTATSLNTPGDTGTIGFFIGDLPPGSPEDQEIVVVYTARVLDDAVNVTAGADLDNVVRMYYNTTDLLGTPTSPPPPGGFDIVSDPEIAEVDAIEPNLVIDKDVNGQVGDSDQRRAKPGETLTYTVRVTNTGTSPAHDIVITDTPDSRLTGFTSTPPVGVTEIDTDPSDGTLEWITAGPIAPGASITITYSVTIPSTLDETDEVVGAEVVNTADVPSYYGASEATRTANPTVTYRNYTDVADDTVNVELDLATIGDRVWYDVDGDGVQDPGEPGLNGVDVTVTFLNGPGALDDETVIVTTNGDGDWLVEDMPGGSYTVSVDTGDVPSGLAPSYDLDNLLVGANGVWNGSLGEAEVKLDVDFGFDGTGSIGDTIWFDQDLNGTQNGTEPGLGGIPVTLVWAGPDGDLGTAGDNITYTTTTSTSPGTVGQYLFDDLPAGNFSVTADGASLPAGMAFVSDPDAGPADGIALVTLTAGENDLAQDFGAAGILSIGDTIYLDRDGDGSQAVSGEPGLEGVTVTLTYAGADGTLGTADDVNFTDVTDASGNYLFENLPEADFRITVTGPLPAASTNTDDPDTPGTGDSTSVVTLTADDFDQDFGYDVNSSLGDRVWWDLDSDGVQDPGEPGINGVGISVTYLGPDGVVGGGDDLVFTTTTSGDGDWSLGDLPDGNYVIAVTGGVPAGFAATYDPDDGVTSPDSSSAMTLTTLDLDQDFGFAGDSSIGDTIWLDQNGDGIQNAGEQGIGGVTVTVTWAGPDGDIGTTGDNESFVRITDSDGEYSVIGLPAGAYEVEVDSSTLPANMTVTYDVVNGTTTPSNSALVPLAASTDRTDVDFGYQGDSSIGDTVYFDRNADGDQDLPGDDSDEPGLEGVTVTVTWAGVDGDLATTGDNVVVTTTTNSAGQYLVVGLPQGEYQVDVTAGLPTAMTNTDDEDGDNDSSTPVTLGANDDHLTADFGYVGAATIGDTIFLDLNGNGTQDVGEPGVPGQTVTLNYEGPDGTLGNADDIVLTTVTDASGTYTFDNLPDGDYRVTVVGGIIDDAVNTADPDGATPNQSNVTITGGADDLDQDFGYQGDNGLGDTVWWDVDRDGVIDPVIVEPRLEGVQVRVTYAGVDGVLGTSDDIVVTTDSTDANGQYGVTGLPDGDYLVEVVGGVPAGMDNTYDADDLLVGPDSASVVNLAGATIDLIHDFGFAGTGAIGDLVYFDRDGDGVRGDPLEEVGIAGVEMTLTFAGFDGVLGTADDIVIVQNANPDGGYLFFGLPAGEYTVAVTDGLPPGANNTDDPDLPGAPDAGDSMSSVTLGTGETNLAQDFGFDVDAGLGDRVWWDFNRDGVQDPGEPGVNGVEVTATFLGADGILDLAPGGDDEPFVTVTSGDGDWFISELPEGNYLIELTGGVPAGFTNTYDPDNGVVTPDGSADLPTHSGLNVAQDFGIAGNSSLGDTVWLDLDGNGVLDGQEVGLADVTVELIWGGPDGIVGGANAADDIVLTTVTDDSGNYVFIGLPAGEYVVAVDPASLPAGLVPSYDEDGTTISPDGSTPVTLPANTDIDTIDFGYQGTARIGDTVFFDRDRDGEQTVGGNGDEPGLAGVTVELTWAGENGVLGDLDDETFTTTTLADGTYEFTGLPAGEYIVAVDTTPTGGLPVGVDNTVDEDGDNNSVTPVTLGIGEDHDTADFGYAGLASIGDTIYLDLDGDGTQGPNEPGIANQTVTLDGPTGTFTTQTDSDGTYSFDNLPDATYTVTVVGGIAVAAVNTDDPDTIGTGDSTSSVTITGGVSDDLQDFGYQGTASLGDTLFFDVDADGIDDGAASEPRLDGIDVTVTWHGPDGVFGTADDLVIPVTATDADGEYLVTGLPIGTYTITPDAADLPAGLAPSVDPDALPGSGDTADGTTIVTLVEAETNLDQDFGYQGTGSIGNTVWLDLDGDDVEDAGEPGLEGATVTVTWLGEDDVVSADDIVYTTTVADDGTYLVENLPAGEYTVEISGLPAGLVPTADPDGGDDSMSTLTLAPAEEDLAQDFGYVGTAGVGDTVFLDLDLDGEFDTGEPTVPGVTVTVTSAGVDGVLGTPDDLVITTVTGPNGTYSVSGLPAGPTRVVLNAATLPESVTPSSDADGGNPASSTVTLTPGENNVDQDFAVAGPGSISGNVFDDGVPGKDGFPGVTVTITYDGPDGVIVITTTTDENGDYSVSGLPIGDYTVEVLPGDWPDGFIPAGPTMIDVAIRSNDLDKTDVDFPFVEPATIGENVYIDINRNGTQDAGEMGVPGVTVNLLDENGNVIATQVTDDNGDFLFVDLLPGTYTVVLDPTTFPNDVVPTGDPDGVIDMRFEITVGPGDDIRTAIFALSPPVLPTTGAGVTAMLWMAALLLFAGLFLLGTRRRRDDGPVVPAAWAPPTI
jgi:large repetitive protein